MKNSRSIWAAVACFAVLVVAFCVVISNPAFAQTITTGEIVGVVSDPSGAAVPNASVSIRDMSRGAVQTATTDKDGVYHVLELLPGDYSIAVTATGFKTFTRQAHVSVGQVATADAKLEIGSSSQTVEVTGQVPLLQTENGNLGTTVSQTQAANIPNPGNDITYIAQITPGTTMNTGGGGYGNFSSFGMSAVSNLFTLDGMDSNDPFLNLNNSGATNLTLGQNEVSEVSVVGDGYSGEYGGLAGANVNYVTKSGSNQFHGEAIWDWNGSALNANGWFNNASGTPKSFVNANQYGADVGGPILKNKIFIYFDAEGLDLLIPTSGSALIPSPQFAIAAQDNINALYGSTSTIAKFYANMFKLYAGAPGASRATNSLGDDGCDGSEYWFNPVLAANEAIPSADQGFGDHDTINNPLGTGTPCALKFISNVGNKTSENLQAWRFDVNISDKDRLFVRMQHDLGNQASYTDAINSLFNAQSNQPEWQGQLEESHDFAAGAVNQFIMAGQWYSAIFGNASSSATLSSFPTTLLMGGGQFSDLGGEDYLWPEGRKIAQAQVSDDFAKPFGKHTLKIGVKFRENWVSNEDYGILTGGLIIPITLDAFLSGGTDQINTFPSSDSPSPAPNYTEDDENSFPTSAEQPFSVWNVGGYLEDDWKLRPNFTLTLAFRGDHSNIATCGHNCFASAATEFTYLPTSPNTPYNQLIQTGQSNMLPALTVFEPQPRVGFAWNIHHTVVRGGAGIFYDNYPGSLLDNFSENPPLDPSFTTISGTISSLSDPASLLANAASSNAGFQAGFKSGKTFNQINSTVANFSPPSLAVAVDYPKAPQYQKWSLEIEQGFGPNTSLSVEYVGNHGIHILDQNNGINGCNATGDFKSLPTCNVGDSGFNPNFGEVTYAESIGVASYNGVTASFTHRYKSGQVQINYTWSHTLDDVSDSGELPFSYTAVGASNGSLLNPQNPFNPQLMYGNSDQDIRHELTANYVWELPIKRFLTFGHGPDRLLKGWMVNGFLQVRTGFPFSLTDLATGSSLENGAYGATVLGTVVAKGGIGANCETTYGAGQPSLGICLNPNDFSESLNGFGNVGRNTFRGPSYWNSDFSIVKHIPIYETAELAIGAQFYNVFNHPNFQAPVADTSSSQFGELVPPTVAPPTSIFGSFLGADGSPRLIQVKLEVKF